MCGSVALLLSLFTGYVFLADPDILSHVSFPSDVYTLACTLTEMLNPSGTSVYHEEMALGDHGVALNAVPSQIVWHHKRPQRPTKDELQVRMHVLIIEFTHGMHIF